MSYTGSHSTEHIRLPKRRIQRRHGACEPCRSSKTKCDGRTPCGACRSERRRQCPCTYSEKVMRLQQVTAEMRRRAEQDRVDPGPKAVRSPSNSVTEQPTSASTTDAKAAEGTRSNNNQAFREHGGLGSREETDDSTTHPTFTPLSLCGTIEEFKKLKLTRGSAVPVVSRCNGFEAIDTSSLAPPGAATKAKAVDPRPQIPELITSIDEVSWMKDRLDATWVMVTQGRLRRAWVELASLVREAEFLETSDTLKDSSQEEQKSWKQLWTNILDLESQLGLALGRPTCVVLPGQNDGKHNMTVPVLGESDLDATRLDLFKYIQSALSLDSASPTISIDFHDRAKSILSCEAFHKVGLCTTEESSASARDLQLNTHLLFMVIYCRLASMCDIHAREGIAPIFLGTEATDTARSVGLSQPRQKLTYCRMMFRSAKFVVSIFLNFVADDLDVVGQNWMRCHSAFIAATLLGIAKLRHEVEWDSTTELLRKLEQAFTKLLQTSPNCALFQTAVGRLQDLNSVKEPASEVTRNKHSGIKHRKPHVTSSTETSPSRHNVHEGLASRDTGLPTTSPATPLKRTHDQMEAATQLSQSLIASFNSNLTEEDDMTPIGTANTSFNDSLDSMNYYQDDSSVFSNSTSFLSSATASSATSFCESEAGLAAMPELAIAHPGPPFAYPFPYNLVHPPMMLYNPAMLGGDPVLLQTPAGVQYFQPIANIGRLNTVTHPQTLEGMNSNEGVPTANAGPPQPYHDRHGQVHQREPVLDHNGGTVVTSSATNTSMQAGRPGMNRRHSAETILLGSNAVPTPVPSPWQQHHAGTASSTTQQRMPRASSTDDTDRAQMNNHEVPQGTFYMPLTGVSQPLFQHPPLSTSRPEHAYFTTDLTSPSGQGADLEQFRHDYSFTCNQQHYIQGQDQWRQMSVNAGVPGGP